MCRRSKRNQNLSHAISDQKKLIDRKLRVCPECRGEKRNAEGVGSIQSRGSRADVGSDDARKNRFEESVA